MKHSNFLFAVVVLITIVSLFMIPTMIFAGESGPVQMADIIGTISSVIAVIFGSGFAFSLRLISKLQKANKEVTEAFIVVKAKVTDPDCIREVKEASEAVAQVMDEIKFYSVAEKLRKVI